MTYVLPCILLRNSFRLLKLVLQTIKARKNLFLGSFVLWHRWWCKVKRTGTHCTPVSRENSVFLKVPFANYQAISEKPTFKRWPWHARLGNPSVFPCELTSTVHGYCGRAWHRLEQTAPGKESGWVAALLCLHMGPYLFVNEQPLNCEKKGRRN